MGRVGKMAVEKNEARLPPTESSSVFLDRYMIRRKISDD